VALNISPTKFVMVSNKKDPSARVTLANIVSTSMLSVTLTVILVLCVWLKNLGSAVTFLTSGGVISNTVKLVFSVLLMLLLVSFAMMVTLYSPGMSVSSGTKVKLKISPAKLVIVNILLVALGKVIFASTVSNWRLSVTFAVMLTVCVWLRRLGTAVTFLTSGKTASVTAVKVVVSVSLMLLLVSFAKKLMLYCPKRLGIEKLALNLSVEVFIKVSSVVVPLGKVIFAVTVSTPMPSVTLAAISVVVKNVIRLPATGTRSNTSGGT